MAPPTEIKAAGSNVAAPSSSSSQPLRRPQPSSASSSSSAPPPPLQLDYKQCLEDLVQKLNVVLPEYETTHDRSSEIPMYRSTVQVDGMSFTSQIPSSTRKAAEQDIAKVAFENLSKKVKDHGCALVCENTVFAKSALDEYAAKLNTRPTYNTVKLEGPPPCFECSVIFDGTKYTGDTAKEKSKAEQLAARAVLLSILGGSNAATLYGMIKSLSRIYAAREGNNIQCVDAGSVSSTATIGHAFILHDHKDKKVKDKKVGTKRRTSARLANKDKVVATTRQASDPQNHKAEEVTTTVHASDPRNHKKKKVRTITRASVLQDNKDIVATTGLASDQNYKANEVAATGHASDLLYYKDKTVGTIKCPSVPQDHKDKEVSTSGHAFNPQDHKSKDADNKKRIKPPASSKMFSSFQKPEGEPSPEAIKLLKLFLQPGCSK